MWRGFLFIGKACVIITLLGGWWVSFGFHISLLPPYIEIHLGWFMFTLMSKKQGEDLQAQEKELEDEGVFTPKYFWRSNGRRTTPSTQVPTDKP